MSLVSLWLTSANAFAAGAKGMWSVDGWKALGRERDRKRKDRKGREREKVTGVEFEGGRVCVMAWHRRPLFQRERSDSGAGTPNESGVGKFAKVLDQ